MKRGTLLRKPSITLDNPNPNAHRKKHISTNLEIIVTESYVESRKNLDPDLEQKEKTKTIWFGWSANRSRSETKKRPRKRSGLAKK